jgi:hypothetical protein
MIKTKFKMKIIWLRLIVLIFFAFFSGDMTMIEHLRWIAHMSRELVDAHSFI